LQILPHGKNYRIKEAPAISPDNKKKKPNEPSAAEPAS
jgi:hypothetical protein